MTLKRSVGKSTDDLKSLITVMDAFPKEFDCFIEKFDLVVSPIESFIAYVYFIHRDLGDLNFELQKQRGQKRSAEDFCYRFCHGASDSEHFKIKNVSPES